MRTGRTLRGLSEGPGQGARPSLAFPSVRVCEAPWRALRGLSEGSGPSTSAGVGEALGLHQGAAGKIDEGCAGFEGAR